MTVASVSVASAHLTSEQICRSQSFRRPSHPHHCPPGRIVRLTLRVIPADTQTSFALTIGSTQLTIVQQAVVIVFDSHPTVLQGTIPAVS